MITYRIQGMYYCPDIKTKGPLIWFLITSSEPCPVCDRTFYRYTMSPPVIPQE